jgi:energy-coupling factor transport system substrate-specific component
MAQESPEKPGLGRGIAAEFTTVAWVLIPIGIGINVVGGVLVNVLRIPLFLDVIGTIMVAVLAGPWAGALTGALTNLIIGLVQTPTWIPYALTSIAIGLVAGYMARAGWFRSIPRVVATALAIMVTAIIVSAPITAYLFGGVTGSGTDAIRAFFLATGRSILEAVLLESLITESIDKLISVFVAFGLARSIPRRYRPENARHTLPT